MCRLRDIVGFHYQSACTGTYRKTKRHLLRNANLFLYHLSGDPTEGIRLWVEKNEHSKTYVHIYLRSHRVVASCQFYRLDVTCKQVATNLRISCCNLLFADLLQLVDYNLLIKTCSKPVGNKFGQSTCNKSLDNLRLSATSHANAS